MSHNDILLNVMKSQDCLYQYFDFGTADDSLINSMAEVNFISQSQLGQAQRLVAGLIM